jgi:2-dehydro-3-deoxyphosphogluconate aldolase/(4S)-4-hydroxy-2-oxoglutarate aldolase
MNPIFGRIQQQRIFAIVTIDEAAKAGPLADALVAAGLTGAEITFRTAATAEAIRTLAACKEMLVGAGTVRKVDQVKQAMDAGARFLVAPGFNADVVRYCVDHDIPIAPGIATPTEIEQALEFGLEVVKFFPAESLGGVKALRALSGPYGMMRWVPTGGISIDNLKGYLAFEKVLACGGSWIATPELIRAGRFDEIGRLARQAVEAAR